MSSAQLRSAARAALAALALALLLQTLAPPVCPWTPNLAGQFAFFAGLTLCGHLAFPRRRRSDLALALIPLASLDGMALGGGSAQLISAGVLAVLLVHVASFGESLRTGMREAPNYPASYRARRASDRPTVILEMKPVGPRAR